MREGWTPPTWGVLGNAPCLLGKARDGEVWTTSHLPAPERSGVATTTELVVAMLGNSVELPTLLLVYSNLINH